jgi:hypothetical protein
VKGDCCGQSAEGAGQVGLAICEAFPTQSRQYGTLPVNEKLCNVTLVTKTCALLDVLLVPFTVVTVTF